MWWQEVYRPEWIETLLPNSSTPFERVLEAVDADLVARLPIPLILAARSPYQCPLSWLPYLASERSVDEFDSAWPEARQRAVIAGAMPYHQVKGTRPALDRAMAPLGLSVKVREWFEVSEQRRPYTFRIELDLGQEPWTNAMRSTFVRTANSAKNLHTLLDGVETRRVVGPATIHVGVAVSRHRSLTVGQVPKPTSITVDSILHVAFIQQRHRSITVGPRS